MKRVSRELERLAMELLTANKKAPKGKYIVELQAVPNVDYPKSSWRGSVSLKKKYKVVKNLKEAQRACRKYIEDNDLGGGNWTGGNIYNDEGDIVGYISYNGRAWESYDFPSKSISEL